MSDKFKPKVGSWECGGCFLRQNADLIQCPACQTAKPGHEEEIKAKEEASKPAVSFGAGGGFKFVANNNPVATPAASAASTTPALGGFKFGGTTAAATSTPTTAPEPAKPTASTGFSFGQTQSTPTGFTFGQTQPTPATGGFSFSGIQSIASGATGSVAATPPAFSLNTSAGASTDPAGENAEDADHDPHFEPIIPLPELINVTTGEEEEEVIFKHRAKVYR